MTPSKSVSKTSLLVAATAALGILAGCTATERGATVGAAGGALIGTAIGGGDGAAVGAAAGAIAGGIAGIGRDTSNRCTYRNSRGVLYDAPCR